jgi:type IV fimbrial biogenesis protein FimT
MQTMRAREAFESPSVEMVQRELIGRSLRRQAGLTATEILIAVTIVGVLAAIAAPNLSALFISNRLDTTVNEFMTALNYARSEAIRRGVGVGVARLVAPPLNCRREFMDWTPGWQVRVTDSGEVLREVQRLAEPLTLCSAQVTADSVDFLPTGARSEGASDRLFVLCYQNEITGTNPKSRSRAVLVSAAGGIRVAPTDADGRPLKPSGASQAAVTSCSNP